MVLPEFIIFNNGHLEIVAPSTKNNNSNISASFLIIAKLLFLFYSWITSSSSLGVIFMLRGIYILETFHSRSSVFLNLGFCEYIKVKAFWDNKNWCGNSKISLVGSNQFLRIDINTKNKWTILKLLKLISVVIFDAELKPDISYELV